MPLMGATASVPDAAIGCDGGVTGAALCNRDRGQRLHEFRARGRANGPAGREARNQVPNEEGRCGPPLAAAGAALIYRRCCYINY
jgi:hypothetical protein